MTDKLTNHRIADFQATEFYCTSVERVERLYRVILLRAIRIERPKPDCYFRDQPEVELRWQYQKQYTSSVEYKSALSQARDWAQTLGVWFFPDASHNDDASLQIKQFFNAHGNVDYLLATVGTNNTAIGFRALASVDGKDNTAIGMSAQDVGALAKRQPPKDT